MQSKYRQHPQSFKYTAVTDTPSLLHAKLSSQLTNEVTCPDGWGMGFLETAGLFKIYVNVCGIEAGGKRGCLHGGVEGNNILILSLNIFQMKRRPSLKSG